MLTKSKKHRELPYCSCVVVAAGMSERMGTNKMRLVLGGVPLIVKTLQAIEVCSCVDEIILVTHAEDIVDIAKLCKEFGIDKVTKIIVGGESRMHSVLAGLMEISSRSRLAAIHDGARPLVTPRVVEDTVRAASEKLAAAPAISLADTIKHVNSHGEAFETPPRDEYAAVQTPQVFEADLIKAALTSAMEKGLELTDDCSAVEALGVKPVMTPGSAENIKVTTPLDILLAEAILRARGGYEL